MAETRLCYNHLMTKLIKEGYSFHLAHAQARLETQIARWPENWGGKMEFLIYGDFQAPARKLEVRSLGIIVYPEVQEHWFFKPPLTVLRASIAVEEKTARGILNVARKINILLGSRTITARGNEAIGWWSQVTHDEGRMGFARPFDVCPIIPLVDSLLSHPENVQQRIRSAMYWVYASKTFFTDVGTGDAILRMYTGYWNAFECLLEAISLLHPMSKPCKAAKQRQIDTFVSGKCGKLTAEDIETCYRSIVDPGLRRKAEHVFDICFAKDSQRYLTECFTRSPPQMSLYGIRNSINHGDINVCNHIEMARVRDAKGRLWVIVCRLFAHLLQFKAPDDKNGEFG